MRLSRSIMALDIQEGCVRCVRLRYSSGSWHVQQASRRDIPPSDDDDETSHHLQTAHAIKSLLQEMNLYPPRNLVTCISGRDAAVRLLALPSVHGRDTSDMDGMVRYELMMQLPVNMDQMGYDYQIVGGTDDGTSVLTAAAKRSVLNRHLRVLSLAGVYPDVVTTSSLALFNAFVAGEPESIMYGRTGLVCLRDSSGDVVVCEDGRLTYARSFHLQNGGGREQLIRELHNSFDTYSKALDSEDGDSEDSDIHRVYLMTEDGGLPGGLTEDDLSQIVPSRWQALPADDHPGMGIALAGARFHTRSTPPSPLRLNLLKQMSQEKRASQRKVMRARLRRMAPAIAVIILLAVSVALWWQVYRAEVKLRLIQEAQQASKGRLQRVSQLTGVEEELKGQIEYLAWAADDYPIVSYRLYQVAQTIPDGLWLGEVYIPEAQPGRGKLKERRPISKLYVVGYAHEQREIEGFLASLRGCDCFSEVRQESTSEVRVSGERMLEFQIGLTSRPGKVESTLAKVGGER